MSSSPREFQPRAQSPEGVAPTEQDLPTDGQIRSIALLGNPNTGKTTLFNRLCGLRHKTSNFPGTTQEARIGALKLADQAEPAHLIDLPGIYSIELDQHESRTCREVLDGSLAPKGEPMGVPDAVLIVLDATNLPRNLLLAGEVLRRRLPTVIAVNMIDLAAKRGIAIDAASLSRELGCPVVLCCARRGQGLDELRKALEHPLIPNRTPPGQQDLLERWADDVYVAAAGSRSGPATGGNGSARWTDRLDRVLAHPVLGLVSFLAIMGALFWSIFSLATIPMDLIDHLFASLSRAADANLPPGMLSELISKGVITGIGATLIFLPQICLLFFLIAILEDTGYLARAAFVVDRWLRPFGLPGHAFVPLLSSHACALPGIMACRGIPDRRDRLATILVAPFMTCSARIPVYVLLTTLLYRDRPIMAAVAFIGCYVVGAAAGLFSALIVRRTILRGKSRPMALELPSYKLPSLRTAFLTTWDRGLVFVKSAGTNILAICVVLWWLSSFPKVAPPPESVQVHQQIVDTLQNWRKSSGITPEEMHAKIEGMQQEAERIEARHALEESFAGQLGKAIQPVFAPLGFDWRLSIGVVTSFAAREVFVSTMAVTIAGSEDADAPGVLDAVASATRSDGKTPIFTPAVCWSLLIYYVLAMQCLPTLAVTARESGSARWALLQLVWMCGVAYISALIVFQVLA
jgi:ferrous iron transport protein B